MSYAPHLDHCTVLAYEKVDGGHAWVPLGTTTEDVWLTDPVSADGQVRHCRVLATNTAGITPLSPAGLDPDADNEAAVMGERLPSDGRSYEYRARAYFGNNEHSPYSETHSITMPRA